MDGGTIMVKSVRIILLADAAYEALVFMNDGTSRLIYSDTLDSALEEVKNCQV